MLSRAWRCSWSSADRQCSNYIWVIDSFIAYWSASYIRGFTVIQWPQVFRKKNGIPVDALVSHPLSQITIFRTISIFKWIFLNEKFCILILIPLMFVSKGPNDNKSALVQLMARHRTGDKLLPLPVLTCVLFTEAYIYGAGERRVNPEYKQNT